LIKERNIRIGTIIGQDPALYKFQEWNAKSITNLNPCISSPPNEKIMYSVYNIFYLNDAILCKDPWILSGGHFDGTTQIISKRKL